MLMHRGLGMGEFKAMSGQPPLTDRNAADALKDTFYVYMPLDLVALFNMNLKTTFSEWGFCDFVAGQNACDGDPQVVGMGCSRGLLWQSWAMWAEREAWLMVFLSWRRRVRCQ